MFMVACARSDTATKRRRSFAKLNASLHVVCSLSRHCSCIAVVHLPSRYFCVCVFSFDVYVEKTVL